MDLWLRKTMLGTVLVGIFLLLCPSSVVNQNFFDIHLAPTTLTSVPYLNGEVTVYQHRNHSGRYYVPPLAIIQLNETKVVLNRLINRFWLRLPLILFSDELYQTVQKYLKKNLQLCTDNHSCEIKMIPIDRLRVVWKRGQALSSKYNLDSSWISNTILLSTIYFNIDCADEMSCDDLKTNIQQNPEILDGLELEYSTPAEKHVRRDVTILGSHVMNTDMFSSLKQMDKASDSNARYLLADDLNRLISEVLSNVEMSDITDAGYMSYDDQSLLREMLKNRIATNQEVLMGHKARQWDSVFWNPDNIRPDQTVKILNDYLSRTGNEDGSKRDFGLSKKSSESTEGSSSNSTSSIDDRSNVASSITSGSRSTFGDKSSDTIKHTDASSANSNERATSSSSSSGSLTATDNSGATSSSSSQSQGGKTGGFWGLTGSSGGSSRSDSHHNSHRNFALNEQQKSQSEAERNRESHQQRDMNYDANAQKNVDAKSSSNLSGKYASKTDVQGRSHAGSDYQKVDEMDEFALTNLDETNKKRYNENRQYLEVHGNRFETKPVTAYRTNLGMFNEKLRLVSKSIVVQRIDAIHAVPIRALAEPYILTSLTERYKISFDEKLTELKTSLSKSINSTFQTYHQQAENLAAGILSSSVRVIKNALSPTGTFNDKEKDLRFWIKRALTETVTRADMGLFDDNIIDYYRYHANVTSNITVVSLLPLKIALHFSQATIEGMVCANGFNQNSARIVCSMFNPRAVASSPNYKRVSYDQTTPSCSFKAGFIHEMVPCKFLFSSLNCNSRTQTWRECTPPRYSPTFDTCKQGDHVDVYC